MSPYWTVQHSSEQNRLRLTPLGNKIETPSGTKHATPSGNNTSRRMDLSRNVSSTPSGLKLNHILINKRFNTYFNVPHILSFAIPNLTSLMRLISHGLEQGLENHIWTKQVRWATQPARQVTPYELKNVSVPTQVIILRIYQAHMQHLYAIRVEPH